MSPVLMGPVKTHPCVQTLRTTPPIVRGHDKEHSSKQTLPTTPPVGGGPVKAYFSTLILHKTLPSITLVLLLAAPSLIVPAGSPSRGGDAMIYAFSIN